MELRSALLDAAAEHFETTGERTFRYARWAYERRYDPRAANDAASTLEEESLVRVNALMRELWITDAGLAASASPAPSPAPSWAPSAEEPAPRDVDPVL